MSEEVELRRAYARCRRMQRRHDPTFAAATRCLPADRRPAVHALYGFVRGADEIVDGPGALLGAPPERRRAALDAWHATLVDGLRAGRSDHPVVAALVDAGPRHGLPLERLSAYMESMRIDCGPVRLASREALDRYMDGSAATVGRIMAPLLGDAGLADDLARLGLAFQLTNFIRDVEEDWALDRVYLPGLPEDDLRCGVASDRFREGVAEEVRRARALFEATADLHAGLDPPVRRGVRLARAVYVRVLDRVERLEFDVLGARPALPAWELAAAGVTGLRGGVA